MLYWIGRYETVNVVWPCDTIFVRSIAWTLNTRIQVMSAHKQVIDDINF